MKEKRDIDEVRDSSGYDEIGSVEDGAIVEMKDIGGRILVIKEKSIYEVIMADTIDPNRTNINLPPTIQKLIINKGSESETVSRTLLTAMTLFRSENILNFVDCNKVIGLTIDLLSEISILQKEIDEYVETENKVSDEYEERRNQKVSFKIPSIVNLESKCKTIFQKADHIEQTLIEIITLFYPNKGLTKQSHFPYFYKIVETEYGETDTFVEFIAKTIYYMELIRELRNGFDHRLEHTSVLDFQLQTDGNIITPTIELNHKKIKLKKTSLNEFLEVITKNTLDVIELTFAYLASKHKRNNGIPNEVKKIPEENRWNKYVRYSFWTPIGEGGDYIQ
jgi:hypothetical protein